MKQAIKIILSILAVVAALAGIAVGIKLFLKKFGKGKKVEGEEFSFDADEIEDVAFLDEDELPEETDAE
jgi:hypothetical protein